MCVYLSLRVHDGGRRSDRIEFSSLDELEPGWIGQVDSPLTFLSFLWLFFLFFGGEGKIVQCLSPPL